MISNKKLKDNNWLEESLFQANMEQHIENRVSFKHSYQ